MWSSISLVLATSLVVRALSLANSTTCTSAERVGIAERIPWAYNLVAAGASYTAFTEIPFAEDCKVLLNANGLPGIEVADTRGLTIAFATTTRQVFSKVTGAYTDYSNGTTIIATNVTLGALDGLLEIPVTFSANVYLEFNLTTCGITLVQAFATIPSKVLGVLIEAPELDSIKIIT